MTPPESFKKQVEEAAHEVAVHETGMDNTLPTAYIKVNRVFKTGADFGYSAGRDAQLKEILDWLRLFKDERNSLRIPAQVMADELEERFGTKK